MEEQNAIVDRELSGVNNSKLVEEIQEEKRQPLKVDGRDKIFACIYLALGYGFIQIFRGVDIFQNFAIFTAVYTIVVMAYLYVRGKRPPKESYFWMVMLLGIGVPYAWWSIMPLLQMLALIFVAAYWTLAASGGLMGKQKTSQWVVCDSLNALFVVPFSNFVCHVKVLFGVSEKKEESKKSLAAKILPIGLGICIAIPILIIALPLLASADPMFGKMIMNSSFYIRENLTIYIIQIILSLPVTAYLFGLIYGGIYSRNTDKIKEENVRAAGRNVRVIPDSALHTAVLVVSAVYLLFIVLQGRYLFSAFAGIRPEEFTYSQYARQGFFELCDIAVLNLGVLLGTNLFTRTERVKNVWLRRGNVLLSVLTFLIITTAISKMMLYINAYGLTNKRILTMVFMIWMLLVFGMMIVWQYKVFPIVRISAMVGAVLFTLLCVVPIDYCIHVFNFYFSY